LEASDRQKHIVKALAGQIAPTSGRLFAGHSIADIKSSIRWLWVISAIGAFHGELTVEENLRTTVALRLPARYRKKFGRIGYSHIIEWLDCKVF